MRSGQKSGKGCCDVSVELLVKGVGQESEGGRAGVSWLLGLARACWKPDNELCLKKSTTLSGVFFKTTDNLCFVLSVLCKCTLELTPMCSN